MKNVCLVGPGVNVRPFGETEDGQEAMIYTLINKNGMKTEITNYGAVVVRLFVPDRNGRLSDVVLGYNNLQDYIEGSGYFGAVVGRYGNRIGGGEFELDGNTYQLATNNSPGGIPCHLHGGPGGFGKVIWDANPLIVGGKPGLELCYLSEDGEEGYPGNLEVTVTYWLTNENTLRVEYQGITDQATPVNLTQHSYFNLRGEGNGDILDHLLYINGDHFTPVNKGMIPTGEIKEVKGNPFDFTTPTKIGQHINDEHEQLEIGGGYDHNWVLNNQDGKLDLAARVYEAEYGRQLEVWTTEPGVQFYSGNSIEENCTGKSGLDYGPRAGLCLETQHYPDSPNKEEFPSTIVSPGEKYQTVTEFRFSTK